MTYRMSAAELASPEAKALVPKGLSVKQYAEMFDSGVAKMNAVRKQPRTTEAAQKIASWENALELIRIEYNAARDEQLAIVKASPSYYPGVVAVVLGESFQEIDGRWVRIG